MLERLQRGRPRLRSARVAIAAGALILAGGLAAYATVTAPRLPDVVAAPGVLALVLIAAGLAGRWPGVLAFGLALLAGQYATALLLEREVIDPGAPLYAGGFVLAAELGFWSLEEDVVPAERALLGRRLVASLAVALGSLMLAALVLVGSQIGVGAGLAVEAAGIAAAAGILAVVARLARRSSVSAE